MRTFALIIAIAIAPPLLAQKYTHLGFEFGTTSSLIQSEKNSDITGVNDDISPIFGINFRKELSKIFSLETGIYYRTYSEYIGIKNLINSGTGGFSSHQIPIKLFADLDLTQKISFHAALGYSLNIEGYGSGGSGISYQDGDRLSMKYTSLNESAFYSLISGSAGARFRIYDELLLTLSIGYNHGFRPIREYEVTYWDSSGNSLSNTFTSNGDYWHLTCNISYPLSKILNMLSILDWNNDRL